MIGRAAFPVEGCIFRSSLETGRLRFGEKFNAPVDLGSPLVDVPLAFGSVSVTFPLPFCPNEWEGLSATVDFELLVFVLEVGGGSTTLFLPNSG